MTGALPRILGQSSAQSIGLVSFEAAAPSLLEFDAFVAGQPDPIQLRVAGPDVFQIIPDEPMFSLGFEFQEIRFDNPAIEGDSALSAYRVTLCESTFAPDLACPQVDVIDRVEVLARFVSPDGIPPFFGVWSNTPIAQVSVEDLSAPEDGNEVFGRVFAGSEPRPSPAVDRFEVDDGPETASFLQADFLPGRGDFVQTHSFHFSADEDWAFFERSDVTVMDFSVQSAQPAFHPLVEFYRSDRLTDPSQPPELVLGSCDGPPGTVAFVGSYPAPATLIRVVNCGVAEPTRYELSLEILETEFVAGGSAGLGQVLVEGTNQPASVALVNELGNLFFSNPQNGEFRFFALANTESTLTVVSPRFDADPVTIPGVGPFEIPDSVTVVVRPQSNVLLADGFE